MRAERVGILALFVAGCLHKPSERQAVLLGEYRARPAPALEASTFTPRAMMRSADVLGSGGAEDPLEEIGFDDTEEPDPSEDEIAAAVPPILAVTGTVATFDIPMSDDERVTYWVEYLTGRGRGWYGKWLGRSTRYVPLFWEILDQYDLPRDLVFLSMIESGFSPRAYSWAHAAGPWQFMKRTGEQYGLSVGFWIDERRDFELATHAAARYLTRLRDYYDGDWYLAWAAYNGGVRRINRAVRRLRTRDFWKLSRTWHLRRETRHYVPKLLAAAKIAKQPEKYGFGDVVYLPPLRWEVVTVTVATDLGTVAKACAVEDEAALVALNPALRTEVTPPGVAYPVRVPDGKREACVDGLRSMPVSERITYRYYAVQRGDDLPSIAKRFATTPESILAFNDIVEAQLHDFDELVVPVPLVEAAEIAIVPPPKRRFRPNRYGPEGANLIVYEVRSGDSLWRIARRFRVSLRKLRLWNGLWRTSRLRVGQKLRLYVGRGRAPSHPRWKRKT